MSILLFGVCVFLLSGVLIEFALRLMRLNNNEQKSKNASGHRLWISGGTGNPNQNATQETTSIPWTTPAKRRQTLQFPFTFVAIANCAVIIVGAIIGHVNLIQLPSAFTSRIAPDEIDDILVAILIAAVAFAADQVLAARRSKLDRRFELERTKAVQGTMRTAQDIVNTCLNQLHSLRQDVSGNVHTESLVEDIIRETSGKLDALLDLQKHAAVTI